MPLDVEAFADEMVAQWLALVPGSDQVNPTVLQAQRDGMMSAIGESIRLWVEGGTSPVTDQVHPGLVVAAVDEEQRAIQNLVTKYEASRTAGSLRVTRDLEGKVATALVFDSPAETTLLYTTTVTRDVQGQVQGVAIYNHATSTTLNKTILRDLDGRFLRNNWTIS